MRMRRIAIALAFFALAIGAGAAPLLPVFHGTYRGTCETTSPGMPPQVFEMTLVVKPGENDQLHWDSSFQIPGQQPIVKNHTIHGSTYPDRYFMKEANGIVLDIVKVKHTLYQQMFLPDNKAQTDVQFTRTTKGIRTKIVTFTTARPRAHEVPGMTRVVGFQLMSVQDCDLRTQDAIQ